VILRFVYGTSCTLNLKIPKSLNQKFPVGILKKKLNLIRLPFEYHEKTFIHIQFSNCSYYWPVAAEFIDMPPVSAQDIC
jgi:hypothetical protein